MTLLSFFLSELVICKGPRREEKATEKKAREESSGDKRAEEEI